jgi:hypothetical protein
MIKFKLMSVAPLLQIEADKEGNRGQYPFIAIVTYGGVPSDGPVGGTEKIKGGPYRVIVPSELLAKNIEGLIGKPALAADELDSHSRSVEVGKFLQAWTETAKGKNGEPVTVAKCSGMLNRNWDPELVDSIVEGARNGSLGFSYDLKEVEFDIKAGSDSSSNSESFLELRAFKWRGATILKREAAAYEMTQLAAQRSSEETEMDEATLKRILGEGITASLTEFTKTQIEPLKTTLQAGITKVEEKLTALEGKQTALEAVVNKKPEVKVEAKADAKAEPKAEVKAASNKVGVDEFTASIAATVAQAQQPLLDGVTALIASMAAKEAKEKEQANVRATLSAAQLQTINRFDELSGDAELTVEGLTAAIAVTNASPNLSKLQKTQTLEILGNLRRNLIRGGAQAN